MRLDPNKLKEDAKAHTGLSDFGDAPLDDGLEMLCHSLSREAKLSDEGEERVATSIRHTLIQRLKVEDCLAHNEAILEQSMGPVLFVVGMPRTGTTALSQYLSEDSAARSIRRWEAEELTPPPDASQLEEDPRVEKARLAFAARDREFPWRRSMLPVAFGDPSEHGPLLGLVFRNLQLPTLYETPSYTEWLLKQDMSPAYDFFAKTLKLLQWKSPAQYWNLKNPPDLFGLDAIDNAFPHARFVWTHRDPTESLTSVCSLSAALRGANGAKVSNEEIGQEQLEFQLEGVRRATAARERIGEDRFVDVYQRDLSKNLVETLRGLYARLGMPFTDEYRLSLERRVAEKPRGQHGEHSYTMAQFGLDSVTVRERFEPYIQRFNVPLTRADRN